MTCHTRLNTIIGSCTRRNGEQLARDRRTQSAMRFTSYTIRLTIVIALVMSLSGASFMVSPAAACIGSEDPDSASHSGCCCRQACECGSSCKARDSQSQEDEQPSATESSRRETGKPALDAAVAVIGASCHRPLREIATANLVEIRPLQTLFDQHTCLRA